MHIISKVSPAATHLISAKCCHVCKPIHVALEIHMMSKRLTKSNGKAREDEKKSSFKLCRRLLIECVVHVARSGLRDACTQLRSPTMVNLTQIASELSHYAATGLSCRYHPVQVPSHAFILRSSVSILFKTLDDSCRLENRL